MATYDLANVNAPTSIQPGDIINCTYCGAYKSVTLPAGQYQLECWGARGGRGPDGSGNNASSNANYGRGGYSKGILTLKSKTTVYLYAGGIGADVTGKSATAYAGGFNGGGNGGALASSSSGTNGAGGGGASDIRIGSTSLYARVIVAGGGGGAAWYSNTISTALGGAGGGVSGGAAAIGGSSNSTYFVVAQPGSATAGGAGGQATSTSYGTTGNTGTFGQGGNGPSNSSSLINSGAGGGGGWYGGGSGFAAKSGNQGHGAGGSGYVYTSSTASNYPPGCELNSTHYLTSASTTIGTSSFTNFSGSTVTGNAGAGACRIKVLSINPFNVYLKTAASTWKKII